MYKIKLSQGYELEVELLSSAENVVCCPNALSGWKFQLRLLVDKKQMDILVFFLLSFSFILERIICLNIFHVSQKKLFSPPTNFRLRCDPHAPCEFFCWAEDFLWSFLRCARDVVDHICALNCEAIVATMSANVLSSGSRHLWEAPEEARGHRHKSSRYTFLREHVTTVENDDHCFVELFWSINSIFLLKLF